ncbi:hypothetical protein SOVF_018450 [Spinacia oleracea]|nr:hypothetical protein SOVF_018450 [Spinacia oleracea]
MSAAEDIFIDLSHQENDQNMEMNGNNPVDANVANMTNMDSNQEMNGDNPDDLGVSYGKKSRRKVSKV